MTSINFDLRKAGPSDAFDLEAPIRACGLFSEEEAQGFIAMLPDLLNDPEQHWLRLDGPGGIVGAAYLSRDGMSADVWNLWFIGVAPEYRGKGGGRSMLTAAEAKVRDTGGRLLLIETSSDIAMAHARGLDESAGYEPQGCIRDYYRSGEDKIIFAKPL